MDYNPPVPPINWNPLLKYMCEFLDATGRGHQTRPIQIPARVGQFSARVVVIVLAAWILTGCFHHWDREDYFPSERPFVFEGVEYPASTQTTETGLHDVYVYFDPQRVRWGLGRTKYRGPYHLRGNFSTDAQIFDQVYISRFDIIIPGEGAVFRPYRAPMLHPLKFERWFWNAYLPSDFEFAPNFDQVPEFFVEIDYEYRSSQTGQVDRRRRVLRFQSKRHQGTSPTFPTT